MKNLFTKIATTGTVVYGAVAGTIVSVSAQQNAFLPQNKLDIGGVRQDTQLLPLLFQWISNAMVLLGIVAVLIIIWSGVKLIISQGNEEAVKSAKKTLLYAAAGFALIVLSYAIVNTLLAFLSGDGRIEGV